MLSSQIRLALIPREGLWCRPMLNNFRQLLRYARPYRVRITVGIAAAVGFSVLFATSIGMLAPVLQVITSPEGLAGWVYRTNIKHRLGVSLDQPDKAVAEHARFPLVDKAKEPPGLGLLAKGDRIKAVNGQEVEDLAAGVKMLADLPSGQPATLTVDSGGESRPVTITPVANVFYRQFFESLVRLLPADNRLLSLFYILLVLLVMTVLRNVLRYTNELAIEGFGIQAIMDMRCDMYHRLTCVPLSHLGRNGVNDSISRVTQDTLQVRVGMTTLFGKTVEQPLIAVCSFLIALWMQWQVVLVASAGMPLAYLIMRTFGKKMHKSAKKALVSQARMLGVLEETLFGLRVVKAYTMEGYERRRFFGVYRKLLKEQMRMRTLDAAVSPLLEVIGFVGLAGAMLLSAYFILNGDLKWELLVTQLGLLAAMGDAARKLSNVNNRLQQAEAAAERINDVLRAEREPAGLDQPAIGPLAAQLEFRDIRFRYPGTDIDVLRGVSIRARAGQITAIVGPNGSGKTSLLSLLPRFYDPQAGQILWDGRDIRQANLRSLRQQIGLVTQDAVIFADTVEANIRYGNKRISREQVVAAAKQAFADEFICQMPEGYDTVVGEHGTTLSGGQRQRIALARAILRDPSVLILDEAMSQVDADSEAKIQRALDKFLLNRTAFVIAHRFSTVRQADQIMVLDAGRIVGLGCHEELMDSCPLYRTLYTTQLTEPPAPADGRPADGHPVGEHSADAASDPPPAPADASRPPA
jgi:subfamily B ATP-binding cassette protein MsbA